MLNVGGPSLSIIVAIPVAVGLLVTPTEVVAVRVKFSFDSVEVSSLIGVRTNTLVWPAAIVAVVAFTHAVPISTCRLVAPSAP